MADRQFSDLVVETQIQVRGLCKQCQGVGKIPSEGPDGSLHLVTCPECAGLGAHMRWVSAGELIDLVVHEAMGTKADSEHDPNPVLLQEGISHLKDALPLAPEGTCRQHLETALQALVQFQEQVEC